MNSVQMSLACAMAVGAMAAAGGSALGQAYTVTDVGLDNAFGINNLGHVCGSTTNNHPGLWINGQVFDLGTFGGAGGYADKINDLDHICGGADLANGNRVAFFYDGSLHNLGTLGGLTSDGRALNHSDLVVGGSDAPGAVYRPYLYQNGQMMDLGSFGGTYAAAEGINDSGVIVGWSDYDTPSSRRAFRYENGQMVDIGTLSGGATVAEDINNGGRIVGYSDNAQDKARAFVYVNSQMYGLGVLPGQAQSYAQAINSINQIVGTCDFSVATKFEPTGPKDLNDFIPGNSGWILQRAQDINDSGQIVGLGWRNNGYHAFLLTPVSLQLANPDPGLPGQNNTFTITHCTPGKRVYLTYSLRTGSTQIEAFCYGVSLDLNRPVVAGSSVANGSGVATFVGFTPGAAAGHTVHYQALELDSCRKTNRVDWTY